MHVKVDQAGRIVLPKKVRERFGLRKNSELELRESAEGIVLKPVSEESLWREEHGWLVFHGRPIGRVNWDRLIEEDREERMRQIGGW
ncbi:MAG TPA: AbrB/MazE/SpoVT family DNA-binding domain-containing protein [Alloacidobacterium sp.]|jgi:AbrB family looped-hinge helix DNA binding protein|nr:AbrB/MazE/SpoVT family DNA-binding domain-containing protein [Alloacidobacterium sp.]